jgi:hypothetical protein
MPLYGQSSGSLPRFMHPGLWPRFRLPSVDRSSIFCGHGDAFFHAFVPAAKALSGAYEEGDRGHAHHHQSLALGIGADALGELYWLPD